MNKNILVTGATGFIGRHLVKELLKNDKDVVFCLVRNLKRAEFLKSLGAKLIVADIVDKGSLKNIGTPLIDEVFHCAAHVSGKNSSLLYKTNIEGTRNVCELAYRLKVKRLMHTSSIAVVSGNPQIPLTEDLPYAATNCYGTSKVEAEKIVLQYREKGLPAVIVRPPIVYGEDEPHALGILLKFLRYRLLPLLNQGKVKLHLGYIENIVKGMIFCINRDECLEGSFFIADSEVLTIKEILKIISEAAGIQPPAEAAAWLKWLIEHLPYLKRKTTIFAKDRVYSLERINRLGFSPPYSTKESLVKTTKEFSRVSL